MNEHGRAKAIAEIARVLKPGGKLLMIDILYTEDYERQLRELGLKDVARSGLLWWAYKGHALKAAK